MNQKSIVPVPDTPTAATHYETDGAELRRLGLRVTIQRLLVLDALRAIHGHTTAEAILATVGTHHPAFNLATVYRILDLLAQHGLVARTHLGGTAWVYELAGETAHHHLVCDVCGAVIQIEDRLIAPACESIEREVGFRVSAQHLALFGTCPTCLADTTRTATHQHAPEDEA